jgi:spore maturation protein CgeB
MFWPEAADPDHFQPLPNLPFDYDVSFIGQCYGQRPAFIRRLREHGLRVSVFGAGWEQGPLASEEMVGVYSRSRVNLGISGIGYSMREMCLKGRDFEVPMCGAAYVTSAQPDLTRVYDVGREVLAYRDADHCAAIIQHLLSNPKECSDLRRAARVRCLRDHTWVRRFRDAFSMLGIMTPSAAE